MPDPAPQTRYYRADLSAYGPGLGRHDTKALTGAVIIAAEKVDAFVGGGFTETDPDGVPLGLSGWRALCWRLGDWLQLVAVRRPRAGTGDYRG